jgi:lipoprotein-releasing system permease protein
VFSFRIAARFLKASKTQTIFIIIGIAVGVSVQVFVGTLIQSLQQTLVNQTIGNSPDVTVLSTTDNDRIQNWESMVSDIKTIPGVSNVTAVADGQIFIRNFSQATVCLVRGFNLTEADGIYHYISTIYAGRLPQNNMEVLAGKELAEQWNLSIGDQLQVFVLNNSKPVYNNLTICGFYNLGVAAVDDFWLIANFSTADTLFKFYDNVTSIDIACSDPLSADTVAAQVNATLVTQDGYPVKVDDWELDNSQLLSGLNGQSLSSYMIQAFVLVSVLLGISSILAITVIQKSKQVGILKAMGVSDRDAAFIFLFEGLLLGVGGAALGVALGYGLMIAFVTFAVDPVTKLPIINLYINYWFLLISGIVAVAAAVVAALVPARRSSKLSVIEVIRNG